MRETPFVEMMVMGGWSTREAATVERWLEDKRPAGKGPIHFCAAFNRACDHANNDLHINQARLLERIDNLEESLGIFGVKSPMRNGY